MSKRKKVCTTILAILTVILIVTIIAGVWAQNQTYSVEYIKAQTALNNFDEIFGRTSSYKVSSFLATGNKIGYQSAIEAVVKLEERRAPLLLAFALVNRWVGFIKELFFPLLSVTIMLMIVVSFAGWVPY